MTLRLRTFGTVSIEADGSLLSGRCTQRRRLALLALLVIARDRGGSRDKLLGYLWPDRDTEHGRHVLSQAIYAIRQELGDAAIVSGIDDLRLNGSVVTSDAADFETALASGRLDEAVSLYAGPFLDGFYVADAPEFERWADGERQRLAGAFGAALESLARAAAVRADHSGAAARWRQRTAHDPLDARITMELMRALDSAGDRAGAIRHARVHAALLEQQLELGPNAAVEALAHELRATDAADIESRSHALRAGMVAEESTASLPMPALPSDESPALLTLAAGTPQRDAPPSELDPHASAAAAAEPLRHSRRTRRTVLWTTGTFAIVLLGAASLASRAMRLAGPLGAPRLVLLGTITGSDDVLAGAVREALRAELDAAPDVRVVGETSMRETLRLMTLPANTPISAPLAVEIAERRGAPLAIVGSVSPLGRGALLIVQLVDTRTGTTRVTLTERPANENEVIRAVTRLATALRASVSSSAGEALSPLPAATTASLPALRSYVLARQAMARLDHSGAIALGEAALVHDSLFALAHYLVGDLLWYVDQQRHSDQHLHRAYELSASLPPRERLIVRARYQHLVRDELDSALASWQLLAASYPDEPLAYEGMRWVYRARDELLPMAAAAESAFHRDSTSFPAYVEGRLSVLVHANDSAATFTFARSVGHLTPWAEREARFGHAIGRGDLSAALVTLGGSDALRRQVVLLATGDLAAGARELERVRRAPRAQDVPRALLLQARAELGPGGSPQRARAIAREAVAWLTAADLSPPAYARLAERAGDVSARLSDTSSIAILRTILLAKDAGRGLPTYRRALGTLDACGAFARGDMRHAASLVARARTGMFHGRPVSALLMLEADAWAALGERDHAARLYRDVLTPGAYADGDAELTLVLRPFARRALAEPLTTASR